jgi:hypothetical protein
MTSQSAQDFGKHCSSGSPPVQQLLGMKKGTSHGEVPKSSSCQSRSRVGYFSVSTTYRHTTLAAFSRSALSSVQAFDW